MTDHVPVMPNISNKTVKKQVDPDVERIMGKQRSNGSDSKTQNSSMKKSVSFSTEPNQDEMFDVLDMSHEPTKEEILSKKTDEKKKKQLEEVALNKGSGIPWLIIILIILVIGLFALIAWWHLKETPISTELSPNILQPNNMPFDPRHAPINPYRAHVAPAVASMSSKQQQAEQMPIKTKSMKSDNFDQPSKDELEEALLLINSGKKLTPSKKELSKHAKLPTQQVVNAKQPNNQLPQLEDLIESPDEPSDDQSDQPTDTSNKSSNDEEYMDNKLISSFNTHLKSNVEYEEEEDAEAEL
jgi:hypothetical protein